MRWSVVLASPCLCTQDALPPRQDYAITRAAPPLPAVRLARLGGSFAASAPPQPATTPALLVLAVAAAAPPHTATTLARLVGAVGADAPHYHTTARRSVLSWRSPRPTVRQHLRASSVPSR